MLKKIRLDSTGRKFLSDVNFSTNYGIVNLHLSRGTDWICYIKENYFDSYGVVCPKKIFKYILKWNGHCLYSEYETQGLTNKQDSYCASHCLYINYLTKVLGIDFNTAVVNLYYQMINNLNGINFWNVDSNDYHLKHGMFMRSFK